jgi:hypothetical protein
MKRGKEDRRYHPRKFVLCEADDTLKYHVKEVCVLFILLWCQDLTLDYIMLSCRIIYSNNNKKQSDTPQCIFILHTIPFYSKVVPVYYMFRLVRAIIRYMYEC